jgi:hypothetical protein
VIELLKLVMLVGVLDDTVKVNVTAAAFEAPAEIDEGKVLHVNVM